METLIYQIARNCEWLKTVNEQYKNQCLDNIEKLEKRLPCGSGIDSGCKIDADNSGINKVIITFGYHFMNENGYYDGWTDYKLIITPAFLGINMKIAGKNRQGIKDYLYDLFDVKLNEKLSNEQLNNL